VVVVDGATPELVGGVTDADAFVIEAVVVKNEGRIVVNPVPFVLEDVIVEP
jgi:hypothetical protein